MPTSFGSCFRRKSSRVSNGHSTPFSRTKRRRSRARVGFCASRPDALVSSARTLHGGGGNAIQKFHRQRYARRSGIQLRHRPRLAYKPTARMRLDISPLFGVTRDSPDVQIFGVFSYVFGGEGKRRGSAGFDPKSLTPGQPNSPSFL